MAEVELLKLSCTRISMFFLLALSTSKAGPWRVSAHTGAHCHPLLDPEVMPGVRVGRQVQSQIIAQVPSEKQMSLPVYLLHAETCFLAHCDAKLWVCECGLHFFD